MRFAIRSVKFGSETLYEWELHRGEQAIAAGATAFASEADARSNIAAFRKAAGGVKFAKVAVEDDA